jgi:hypothetical protein
MNITIRQEFYKAYSTFRLINNYGVNQNSKLEHLIHDPHTRVVKVFRWGGLPPSIPALKAASQCLVRRGGHKI